MNGYSITVIPKSWAIGRWYRPRKTIYALGPLRFTVHRFLGSWQSARNADYMQPALNKGVWLPDGGSRPDRLTDGKEVPPGLEKVL